MAFAETISQFFSDFAENATVNSVDVQGIFDLAGELVLGDTLTQAPALQVPASVAAAAGQTCVVRGVSYLVRQVIDLPPDGAVRQLVLVRA